MPNDRKALSLLCMGDILVDMVSTIPSRELVDCSTFRRCPGGSALNTAVVAARMGCPTAFAAIVGADFFGGYLKRFLDAEGVDTSALIVKQGHSTGIAFTSSPGGKPTFDFVRSSPPPESFLAPEDCPERLLERVSALHLGSRFTYQIASASFIQSCLEKAHRMGVLVTYDPNIRPASVEYPEVRHRVLANIASSHIVKLSDDDAARLFPGERAIDTIRRLHDSGPDLVVLTLGSRGAFVSHSAWKTAEPLTVPTPLVSVRDTVGAGDACMGALLAGLNEKGLLSRDSLAKASVEVIIQIVRFSCAAGAAACTAFGSLAGIQSKRKVLRILERSQEG